MSALKFHIANISCGGCVAKILALFPPESGLQAEIDLPQKILTLTSDDPMDAEGIEQILAKAGYPGEPVAGAPAVVAESPSEPVNEPEVSRYQPESAESCPLPQSDTGAGSQASTETASGAALPSALRLSVPQMSCASCVSKIETAVAARGGVARVNLADKQVRISGLPADAAIAAIAAAGYDARLEETTEAQQQSEYRRRLWQAAAGLGLGIPLMLWGLLGGDMSIHAGTRLGWGLVGLLCLGLLLFTGGHFFAGMWRSFKAKSATMDTLIALGTGTAWGYSMALVLFPLAFPEGSRHVYFEASVMIVGLINLGLALELRARGKTSEALRRLLGLRSEGAWRLEQGEAVWVNADRLSAGDLLRLKPGDRVAVDGEVLEGESLLDESMLTGEPLPVAKVGGDSLYAGTVNGNGAMLYRATAAAADSRLAKIISLVEEAQTSKLPIGRLTDKIAAVFVPVVVLIALVSAMIWYLYGPAPQLSHALVVLTSVLIIACPCALGLATPMSIMVAVGRAAAMGVLIRSGEALQQASAVTTVVLDKTGTLTLGKPAMRRFHCQDAQDEETVLTAVASLERLSSHPLSQALAAVSEAPSLMVSDFANHPGEGVSGTVDGSDWLIGNLRLMTRLDVELGKDSGIDVRALLEEYAGEALTGVLVARNRVLKAVIGIGDPLREDCQEAMDRLKAQGKHLVLLSGDNANTAVAVARAVGIDEVIANVMPDEKHAHIARLKANGEVVAMVGDGINDAPALAAADVGIAMGSGTEVAIESAAMTLLSSRLTSLPDAFGLAKATMDNIHQNLFGAFIYNTLGIPVAAGVLYPWLGILLSPVVAGAAMAMSSLTVVTNANRLRTLRLK